MTIAVCQYCGEFKFGALVPCPDCGQRPKGHKHIEIALTLTDHTLERSELEELSGQIKNGTKIVINDSSKDN